MTRNYYLTLAATLLSLGAVTMLSAQDNLAQIPPDAQDYLAHANGNAEQTDISMGDWKTGWGNWSYDTTEAAEGKQSFKLTSGVQIYNQDIPVEPGYRYYFSARCKIKNFKFVKSGQYGVGFGMEQILANGDRNGNWYDMYAYGIYGEGDQDWTYTVGSWVPKDTTKFLRPALLCKADNGSEAWFDDLKIWKEPLEEKAANQLSNIIENASAEIIYSVDTTPFGYHLFNPAGERVEFGRDQLGCADKTKAALQASSITLFAPATLRSPIGKLMSSDLQCQASVLPERLNGNTLAVRVEFYDVNGAPVGSRQLGTVAEDAAQWQTVTGNIPQNEIPEGAEQACLSFELSGGASEASCSIDDLRIMVQTKVSGLPVRPYDPAQATVTVDAAATGKIFESPLCAYDHHCTDRVYSYSIGTAGPHLEGENRFYEMQGKLGIKYVRVHNGFDGTTLTEHLAIKDVPEGDAGFKNMGWSNGEEGVRFSGTRINPETGKPFPPVVTFDEETKEMVTDFSSIQYYLDHGVLRGGARPIFDLAGVPMMLAVDRNSHYGPRDWGEWEEFIERFFRFLVATYGEEEILKWKFETGNEPSTEWTFHGRYGRGGDVVKDFLEMQDHTVAAAERVLPGVFIAGPSGPPTNFFLPMIRHAAAGENYAEPGRIGSTLNAISYHGYMGGTPSDLSWRFSEEQVFAMMRFRDAYEKESGKKLEVWNTEFAPIYLEVTPKNPPVAAYDNHIQAVATLHMTNFSYNAGITLMTYFYRSPFYMAPVRGDHPEFTKSKTQANTPEFLGESTIITFHGVFKPVSRIFQMLSGLNGGAVIPSEATNEPIFTMAVRDQNAVKLICYSFDLDPTKLYDTNVTIQVNNLEPSTQYSVERIELSSTKANSWYLATRDNVTQKMCEDDISVVDRLNKESEFVPETLPTLTTDAAGKGEFQVTIPAMSASCFTIAPSVR